MKTIQVGTLSAKPGTKVTGYLTPLQWYDGSYCRVPVAIINGARPGPTLWIQCASHGNEYQGMGAVQRLIVETDPETLSGALILVPVLNIVAFNAQRDRAQRFAAAGPADAFAIAQFETGPMHRADQQALAALEKLSRRPVQPPPRMRADIEPATDGIAVTMHDDRLG